MSYISFKGLAVICLVVCFLFFSLVRRFCSGARSVAPVADRSRGPLWLQSLRAPNARGGRATYSVWSVEGVCVVRASILAGARPPAPRFASSLPPIVLASLANRGLIVDHCRVRVHKQEPPWSSNCEPKPRNERGFVPYAPAWGIADERERGAAGGEGSGEGRPQNTNLCQCNLSGPSECEE